MECLICFEIKNNILICPNENCNKSVCGDCIRKIVAFVGIFVELKH